MEIRKSTALTGTKIRIGSKSGTAGNWNFALPTQLQQYSTRKMRE